jgi:hypothetical protein
VRVLAAASVTYADLKCLAASEINFRAGYPDITVYAILSDVKSIYFVAYDPTTEELHLGPVLKSYEEGRLVLLQHMAKSGLFNSPVFRLIHSGSDSVGRAVWDLASRIPRSCPQSGGCEPCQEARRASSYFAIAI